MGGELMFIVEENNLRKLYPEEGFIFWEKKELEEGEAKRYFKVAYLPKDVNIEMCRQKYEEVDINSLEEEK